MCHHHGWYTHPATVLRFHSAKIIIGRETACKDHFFFRDESRVLGMIETRTVRSGNSIEREIVRHFARIETVTFRVCLSTVLPWAYFLPQFQVTRVYCFPWYVSLVNLAKRYDLLQKLHSYFGQIQITSPGHKKQTLSLLANPHKCTVQKEQLHVIPNGSEVIDHLMSIRFCVSNQHSFHILGNHDLWA